MRGDIIYSSSMTTEEALRKNWQQVADRSSQIREAALVLRGNVMNAEKAPFPENLTLKIFLKAKFKYRPMYHYSLNI